MPTKTEKAAKAAKAAKAEKASKEKGEKGEKGEKACTSMQRPLLKWLGGKTQLMDRIVRMLPTEVAGDYYEPFVGGGSVLMAVLSLRRAGVMKIGGTVYASDANAYLMNVYRCVQADAAEVHRLLSGYLEVYDGLGGSEVNRKPKTEEEARTSKESYYYWMRACFNGGRACVFASSASGSGEDEGKDEAAVQMRMRTAAQMMFLNKTCFRGVYREGPNGFNVPYGHYKTTPSAFSRDEFIHVGELMADVVFEDGDFGLQMGRVGRDDFVYADPPYVPVVAKAKAKAKAKASGKAKSFVEYTAEGFDLGTHKRLFGAVHGAHERGGLFLLSNASVPLVEEEFGASAYERVAVTARRAIHSKSPDATASELLIRNYES